MSRKSKWTEQMDNDLRENISRGHEFLAKKTGVTLLAVKKRCNILGLRVRDFKPKKVKANYNEKFKKNTHVIKNNSIDGKTGVWIPEEKMTIYVSPGADIDAVVSKYRNRHGKLKY